MNDLKVILLSKEGSPLLSITPDDNETRRYNSYGSSIEQIDYLNISPKEFIKKDLSVVFTDDNVDLLKEVKVIQFSFLVLKSKVNKYKKVTHWIKI
ncbi:hypothetical protein QUF84_00265 [Fictibacillus enclensis]|uniref:hypothetical protein n=1 Tax=Fictibacillus enclensis TaxID=1017270 RepID=UPI0025A2B2ED|nr:hypothetical protein [Fictibacillus enclensis]MDM5335730.1 hypothetical protein [Fictibacillus enclensis]